MSPSLKRTLVPLCKTVCFLAIVISLLAFLSKVLMVKDEMFQRQDNYARLPKNSVDLLILGSSHSGDGISPDILNESLGLTSFNQSINGLRAEYAPYRLEAALTTQSPKLVVLDTYLFESYWNEEDKVASWALDSQPLNLAKIKTIQAFAPADKLPYYVPLVKYHSRYRELTQADFDFLLNPSAYAVQGVGTHEIRDGYLDQLDDYFDQDLSLDEEVLPLSEGQKASMDQVVALAKQHGAQLLFVTVPYKEQMGMNSVENHRISNYLRQLYEGDPAVQVLDMNEHWAEIEFGYADLRNEGHMNPGGREKTSLFLADYIWGNYDFVE